MGATAVVVLALDRSGDAQTAGEMTVLPANSPGDLVPQEFPIRFHPIHAERLERQRLDIQDRYIYLYTQYHGQEEPQTADAVVYSQVVSSHKLTKYGYLVILIIHHQVPTAHPCYPIIDGAGIKPFERLNTGSRRAPESGRGPEGGGPGI